MRPEDRDDAYLWDMREFAREAYGLVQAIAFAELDKDWMRKLALERLVGLLGVAARKVSKTRQESHPSIEWRKLIGQRAVLAHDYGKLDHRRLYDSVRTKVPPLIAELDRILGGDE